MFGLFKRKADPRPALTIHLNARLQPMHRFEAFEDPLELDLNRAAGGLALPPDKAGAVVL